MIGRIAAALMLGGAFFGASARAADRCTIGQMLQLPVTMIGRSPTVPTTLNGHKAQLVVDSGAFFSTLSSAAAQEFDLPHHAAPYGLQLQGIGGNADVEVATVKDFGFGGISLHNVEFLVGGSDMGQAGLLGQNILGVADVEYDLAGGAVRLMRPHDCRHANLAYWAKGSPVSVVGIESKRDSGMHTEGTVVLDGIKLRAVFDTGAATTILTRHAAERAGFDPDAAGVDDAGATRGLGRQVVRTWIAPFDALAIGDNETIKKIKLRVGDIDGADYDMLIGADFFLSHRVYVSNDEHKLFFTYNGGPVFDLTVHHDGPVAAAMTSGSAPTTAEEYSGRGSAFAARHEFVRARKDLDQAIVLAPEVARYRVERARIELAGDDEHAAATDLDTAVKLAPDNAEALMMRAWLRLTNGDKAAATADADRADRVLATQNPQRLELAMLDDQLGRPVQAIAQYGKWIDAHPVDSQLPMALNNRCWLRALAGTDLDDAIHDCNRAVHLRPKTPGFLDSRGFAYFRVGKFKDAIDDYNDALRLDPKLASSLYGRGLARRRLGDTAAGDKDIAAAKAIDPDVAKPFEQHGVTR